MQQTAQVLYFDDLVQAVSFTIIVSDLPLSIFRSVAATGQSAARQIHLFRDITARLTDALQISNSDVNA